jgi:hypothetical protein
MTVANTKITDEPEMWARASNSTVDANGRKKNVNAASGAEAVHMMWKHKMLRFGK